MLLQQLEKHLNERAKDNVHNENHQVRLKIVVAECRFRLGDGRDVLNRHQKSQRGRFQQIDGAVAQVRRCRHQRLRNHNPTVGLDRQQTNRKGRLKLAFVDRFEGRTENLRQDRDRIQSKDDIGVIDWINAEDIVIESPTFHENVQQTREKAVHHQNLDDQGRPSDEGHINLGNAGQHLDVPLSRHRNQESKRQRDEQGDKGQAQRCRDAIQHKDQNFLHIG